MRDTVGALHVPTPVRLLPSALQLHDVRDVEALCSSVLGKRLGRSGGYLRDSDREDALTYLLTAAWELSGLDKECRRPRVAWQVAAVVSHSLVRQRGGLTLLSPTKVEETYLTHANALSRLSSLQAQPRTRSAELAEVPVPGAYDPSIGLSFCSFATRILWHRFVDWYRDHFDDARYGKSRAIEKAQAELSRAEASGDEPAIAKARIKLRDAELRIDPTEIASLNALAAADEDEDGRAGFDVADPRWEQTQDEVEWNVALAR